MDELILQFDDSLKQNLYIQIYNQLKDSILAGELPPGTKLPSLRNLSKKNRVSMTTVEAAYNQLLVEGYIVSRPKSGYYVSDSIGSAVGHAKEESAKTLEELLPPESSKTPKERELIYDEANFEFSKWKKCMNKVFNEYAYALRRRRMCRARRSFAMRSRATSSRAAASAARRSRSLSAPAPSS